MGTWGLGFAVAAGLFTAVDLVWLGTVGQWFYRPAFGDLMAARTNWAAAVVFYLIYAVGIVVFAVPPGLRSQSVATAAAYGAAFGFVAYATYDLTNLATIRDWPLKVALVDMAWGALLTAAAAAAACFAMLRFGAS